EDGIGDDLVTGVQTCALPILAGARRELRPCRPGAGGWRPPRRSRCTPRGRAATTAARPAPLPPDRAGSTAVASATRWPASSGGRSEERRVGKEGRARASRHAP